MKKNKITYSEVGDDYSTKDPTKVLAQAAALKTGRNLEKHGCEEVEDSRGESAYVWKQGRIYMAANIEGLGTKNLVADATRKITTKTYYDVIGYDTVATIINDLCSLGAQPLTVHAYWAVQDNKWLQDELRMRDLITGWSDACNQSGASWGGGETPTLKEILIPNTAEFGGSAVGFISSKSRLITDTKLRQGDRILLLKSNGVNANGLSLVRAVATKLKKGYATKLVSGKCYGEAILTKTNIYAKLIQDLLNAKVDIHYISNITGHGLRKIMRARPNFTYVLDKIFDPQEVYLFIQKHSGMTDDEMYGTYNMGMDYALFIPEKDVKKAMRIIARNKFEGMDAGYIEKGEKQVVIKPKNLIYKGKSLDLR